MAGPAEGSQPGQMNRSPGWSVPASSPPCPWCHIGVSDLRATLHELLVQGSGVPLRPERLAVPGALAALPARRGCCRMLREHHAEPGADRLKPTPVSLGAILRPAVRGGLHHDNGLYDRYVQHSPSMRTPIQPHLSRAGSSTMFGNKQEKADQDAVARIEADRLLALPVPDFAAEVMRAFGPGGVPTTGGRRVGTLQIAVWLMKPFPRGSTHLKVLLDPIREGLQALENAGLVLRRHLGQGSSEYVATRVGESALADGSVRQHLGGPVS